MAGLLSKFIRGAAGGAGQALQAEHQNKLEMEKMEKWERTKAEIMTAREAKLKELNTGKPWGVPAVVKDGDKSFFAGPVYNESTGEMTVQSAEIPGALASRSTGETPEDLTNRKIIETRSVRDEQNESDLEFKPQIEQAVTTARQESEAAVSKRISEMGQLNKLEDADAAYESLSGANLEKIYGYGEKWYPDFLRSQEGIDLIAQRDQLVSMLTLAARGELKGQGPITDQEAETLEKAATGLKNTNISPTLARRYLDSAMSTLYRNAGQQFEPGNSGQSNPAIDNTSPPATGARLAPDGNWYVEKNGQYFRVDK